MISRVPRTGRRTDRRGALRSAALGMALLPVLPVVAGCDATDTDAGRGEVRPDEAAAAADQALVDQIAHHIAGTRAAAVALATHDKADRTWLLGLAAMHEQHLRRLGATRVRPRRVTATSRVAMVAAEKRLAQQLVASTGHARSGALAQVLASMAAAIGQRTVGG